MFQIHYRIAEGNEFYGKYLEKENCQFYDQHKFTEHILNKLMVHTEILHKNLHRCKNDINL